MAEKSICEECGVELPSNAPEGLCPRCLADMGMRLASTQDEPDQLSRAKTTQLPPATTDEDMTDL